MKAIATILITSVFTAITAEPPVVTSKAAKELLKHPEFKKALEAAPSFTKDILKVLDELAPKDLEPNKAVIKTVNGIPIYSAHDDGKWIEHALDFYDGMTLKKLKELYGKPDEFTNADSAWKFEPDYNNISNDDRKNRSNFYSEVTEKYGGFIYFYIDKKTSRVVAISGGRFSGSPFNGTRVIYTSYGKKIGYK